MIHGSMTTNTRKRESLNSMFLLNREFMIVIIKQENQVH